MENINKDQIADDDLEMVFGGISPEAAKEKLTEYKNQLIKEELLRQREQLENFNNQNINSEVETNERTR